MSFNLLVICESINLLTTFQNIVHSPSEIPLYIQYNVSFNCGMKETYITMSLVALFSNVFFVCGIKLDSNVTNSIIFFQSSTVIVVRAIYIFTITFIEE